MITQELKQAMSTLSTFSEKDQQNNMSVCDEQ